MPLEAVNAAGRAEKAVPKKGHPATMHLWWSRKPLGVARAVLFASLVDDPAVRPDLYRTEAEQQQARQALLALTGELSRWERSGDSALLAEAQRWIRASVGDDTPRIIDPFCGGGAISTEAMRLGLDTLAIDLNPVAALVSAVTVSVAQRFAGAPAVNREVRTGGAVAMGGGCRPRGDRAAGGDVREGGDRYGSSSGLAGTASDIAHYGAVVEAECRRRLEDSFEAPVSQFAPSGRTVAVSYLWARTVMCSNPACRRTTPLLSTWWLSKKPTNPWHARPVLRGDRFEFAVAQGPPPKGRHDLKVSRGANFSCLFCGVVNDADWVRRCGQQSGFGLRLVAVQAFADPTRPRRGRVWLAPNAALERAGLADWDTEPSDRIATALSRKLPADSGNVTAFGLETVGDLLSPRQRRTMATFSEVIAGITPAVERDAAAAGMAEPAAGVEGGGRGARAYAEAVTTYLAVALSSMANRTTTMTTHNRANGSVEQSFIRPAYGFYGEFAEANPFSGSTGSWAKNLEGVVEAVKSLPAPSGADPSPRVGGAEVRCGSMLAALDGAVGAVCTDPPYYDMFDYASLSNLFLVWLRATVGDVWPDTLGPLVAPSEQQIVSNAAKFGGDRAAAHSHFETRLRRAFERMAEVQDHRYPLTVYYGYQQVERTKGDSGATGTAWEALLGGLISAGLRITATWPLRTERPEGVKKGTKSLASSVLLVCRPKAADSAERPATTIRELRRALRIELPPAVATFQQADIAPVDLAQAAIGPGMAVYTRYERVLGADGSPLGVRGALALINEVLDETLLGASADLDADTRWALTWFDGHCFADGPYGPAEQLSKARNTSVAGLVAAGIVAAAGDQVRLLGRHELEAGWDPAADRRLTVWEATQHLLRSLHDDGEPAAAMLLGRLEADTADAAHDLAYRLFQICARRGWSAEAAACNGLVTSWPELTRLAARSEQSLL